MKKNLFALGSVVLAITFSAFTTKPFATVYYVYDGSGTEKLKSNYTFQTTSPGTITGNTMLAWFRGSAVTPSAPTDTEFNNSFEAVDGDFGGIDNDLLSDETENHINIEKKADDLLLNMI